MTHSLSFLALILAAAAVVVGVLTLSGTELAMDVARVWRAVA